MAPHGVPIVGRSAEAEISSGSTDQHLSGCYSLVLECWTSARTKRGKQGGRKGEVQVEERNRRKEDTSRRKKEKCRKAVVEKKENASKRDQKFFFEVTKNSTVGI